MARAGGCGAGSRAQGPVCPAQRPRARMAGSQRSEEARAEREKWAWFRDQEARVHPALLLPTVWPQGGPSASPNLRFLQTPPSGPGRLRCKPPTPRLPTGALGHCV